MVDTNQVNHLDIERRIVVCNTDILRHPSTAVRDKAHDDWLSKALAKLKFHQIFSS